MKKIAMITNYRVVALIFGGANLLFITDIILLLKQQPHRVEGKMGVSILF